MSILLQKTYEQTFCRKLLKDAIERLVEDSMSEELTEAAELLAREIPENIPVSAYRSIVKSIHVELLLSEGYKTSMSNLIGKSIKYTGLEEYNDSKLLLMFIIKYLVEYQYVGYSMSLSGHFQIGSFKGLPDEMEERAKRVKFLPPMVVPPRPLKENKDTPYYYTDVDSFMGKNPDKSKDREIRLDLLNQQNAIPFTINEEVYAQVRDKLKDKSYADDDEDAYGKEYQRKEAFKHLTTVTGETVDEMVEAGNKFWLPHGIDSRGRIYCRAYHISYQSNAYRKAIIDFHERREVDGVDSKLGDTLKQALEI